MTALTLTEFLLARIAEDEAVARESFYEGQRWVPEEEAVVAADKDLDPLLFLDRKRDAAHASNWPPARVLAECEAKNALLDLAIELTRDGNHAVGNEIMERLALAYVDHPDYIAARRP